ncbi:MAG TPA: ATP-binding protein [Rhodopila sp.]
MSLRVRLIASILCVFFVSLCVGGGAVGWHAIRSVRTEMQAAFSVAVQTLRNGLDGLAATDDPAQESARLVRMFDGDRHVRAELRTAARDLVASSTLHPVAADTPEWFAGVLSPAPASIRFDLGPDGTITLEPDPRNEISEVWTQLKDGLVAIGLFCGLSISLVAVVVRQALRPLDRLSAALVSLGAEEYGVRVPEAGPPEVMRVARGLNTMAERLDAARQRNLRLNQRLLTLQEEERADLARDLHDEIGPFLFAVNIDAATIEQLSGSGRGSDIADRTRAIREAVEHMQRHVRAMLHRLRPASPVEAGLTPALHKLIAFWHARRPGISFTLRVTVGDDVLDPPISAAIYRLVQEGLNNAVRHGDPDRVDIILDAGTGEVVVQVADDGIGIAAAKAAGFGLTGMRERVEALGGTLRMGAGARGRGLVVAARLPCAAALGA